MEGGEEGSVECGEGEGMREGKAVERLNGQHMQVRSHSVIKTNVKSGQTHRERQRKGPTGPEAVLLGVAEAPKWAVYKYCSSTKYARHRHAYPSVLGRTGRG